MPFFSILMPSYNQAQFVGQALDSVLAQNFGDFEAILVNDGSMDNTKEIVEDYAAKDSRIKVLYQQNAGTAAALNKALENATGDWICWLSTDDLFMPNHLSDRYNLITSDSKIEFIHSDGFFKIEDQGGLLAPYNLHATVPPSHTQTLRLLRINYVSGIAITIKRELFQKAGHFQSQYSYAQDYAAWVGFSLQKKFTFISNPSVITRIHKGQITAQYGLRGLLDSAMVGLDVFNHHTFSDLIKFADLRQENQLIDIVHETLFLIFDPNSYLNKAGFTIIAIQRFEEWLHHHVSGKNRSKIITVLQNFLNNNSAVLGNASQIIIDIINQQTQKTLLPLNGKKTLEDLVIKLAPSNPSYSEELKNYLNHLNA